MAAEGFTLAGLPRPQFRAWLPLAKETWRTDVVAGITLWGLAVPQGIAYAGLAGLAPAAGIWPVVIVLAVYALWGSSRQLVCTPLSSTAVMMAGLIATFSGAQGPGAASAVLLATAACFLLAYAFRLGFLVNFISDPINAGFMFGLSIVIAVGQANKLLGVSAGSGNAFEQAWHLLGQLPHTNPVTLGLSVLGFAIMLGLPRLSPRAPAGLAMIAATTILVAALALDSRYGVATPGAIPTGLPQLVAPDFAGTRADVLISGAVGMMLLALSEASSNGRELATKNGEHYRLNVDLFPFALGNALSAAVGGVLAVGSTSTTSANVAAGAKTPISTLTTAAIAAVTVLFLGGAVASLPMAALAVLIIVSVSGRINLRFLDRIRTYSAAESAIAAVAAAGVLLFGVLDGLVIAMVASLVWFVYRTTAVDAWRVGLSSQFPALVREGTPTYEPLPEGIVAMRFRGQVFYGNVVDAAGTIETSVIGTGSREHPQYRTLVLDFSGQDFLDYTSAQALASTVEGLQSSGTIVVIVGVRDALADAFAGVERRGRMPANVTLRRGTDVRPLLADLRAGRVPGSDEEDTAVDPG